ncbi:MAG: alpha/beta fold hydrolase [Wenzhouxiangella sp.]
MKARGPAEARTPSGIFYRRHGPVDAGSALLLCHGLASNSSRWNELGRAIDLPPGWCMICPDLRGHGRSQWRGKISHRVWIDDLLAILDHAKITRAVIGGHCMGANLALHFAHQQSQRCNGLVLIEPMLAQARAVKQRRQARMRWLLPSLATMARFVNGLGIYRRNMPVLDLEELDRTTRQSMAEQGNTESMTSRYASPIPDLKYISTAAYMQSLNETIKPVPPLSQIGQPALGLISTGGMFGDPELTRRALCEMPDCRVEQLQAEHWIPTEQPEQMRNLISQWLLTRFG